jgi:hypothetical protein
MTSQQVTVACARRVGWGRNEILISLYLIPCPSALMCSMQTQVSDIDSHHWPYSTFILQITDCFLYCFLGLWAFWHHLLLLTYVFASNIWICGELDPWHIVHILGFVFLNYLPICLMIVAPLAIFQVWVWVGVYLGWSGRGRCAIWSQDPLALELFSSGIRKSSWNHSSQCGIIPLCQVLQKFTSVSVAVFIRQYSSVIRNIMSVPSV